MTIIWPIFNDLFKSFLDIFKGLGSEVMTEQDCWGSSNERKGLQHRPQDRTGKGVEHSADDKHIGWKFEFSFYAFYDPKMPGTLESIVSDMYNPYRCKIDTEAPLGGWRRLFALHIIPATMYTMFEVTTGRAVPNQDVMISFHKISMESQLNDCE